MAMSGRVKMVLSGTSTTGRHKNMRKEGTDGPMTNRRITIKDGGRWKAMLYRELSDMNGSGYHRQEAVVEP